MMNPKITVAILAIAAFVAIGAGTSNGLQPARNLKVLPKDISHEKLDSIMHSYNKALGVRCSFCHTRSAQDSTHLDFAADGPVKDVALNMLRMNIDINSKYFRTDSTIHPAYLNTVTCNTCHKGDAYPAQ